MYCMYEYERTSLLINICSQDEVDVFIKRLEKVFRLFMKQSAPLPPPLSTLHTTSATTPTTTATTINTCNHVATGAVCTTCRAPGGSSQITRDHGTGINGNTVATIGMQANEDASTLIDVGPIDVCDDVDVRAEVIDQ